MTLRRLVARRAPSLFVLTAVALAAGACPPPPPLPPEALSRLPTGSLPNDVVLGESCGRPAAWVPASGDSRLDVFFLDGATGAAPDVGGVFFPPDDNGVFPSPWSVANAGEGRAVVTLFAAHAVALVDTCRGVVLDVVRPDVVLPVSPPRTLPVALDVVGDGQAVRSVEAMRPRSPQAVLVRDGVATVSFTNILYLGASADDPSVFGPGAVLRFDVVGDRLAFKDALLVPDENPQGLAPSDEGVWVSCSGALGFGEGGVQAARSDGGFSLVVDDGAGLRVARHLPQGRQAPGTPVVHGDLLVTGGLLSPLVRALDVNDGSERYRVALPGGELDSIFEVKLWRGVLLAPVFSSGEVHRLDAATGAAVDDAVRVGRGAPTPDGVLAIDARADESGVDGIDAVVLLGLSAEIVPLAFEAAP